MMNLLIVGVKFPPETFIMNKLRTLVQRGCRVIIYSHGDNAVEGNLIFKEHKTWNQLSPWRRMFFVPWLLVCTFFKHPIRFYALLRAAATGVHTIRNYIKKLIKLLPFAGEKPDIILFEWNSAAVEYEALFQFFKVPVVISCRGSQINIALLNPERKEQAEAIKQTLMMASAVHCVSKDIREAVKGFGIKPCRIFINRPAVDTAFFSPAHATKSNPFAPVHIISIGSLIWKKGYEYGLEAIHLLMRKGFRIRYQIIGDGIEYERLLFTIADMGLTNVVKLCGQLEPTDVCRLLQASDIYLLSSLSEGISNGVLEAMACGLPVVSTDCGGMQEAITDGVEGFVVQVRDTEVMAGRLEKLINEPNLRASMGKAGRNRIENEFSLDKQAGVFLQEYRRLISSG